MYAIHTSIQKYHVIVRLYILRIGQGECGVVGYGGGVTLPWDAFQLSKKAAASPFPILMALSAGVSPYYIHPHDDPERDEPCRTDNTQTDRQTW